MRFHKLLFLGLTATVLFAQMGVRQGAATRPGVAGQRMRAAGGGIAALKNFLGLSDQQVEQLLKLRQDERQALKPIREQIQEKAKALNAAREATNPDAAAVGKLVLDLQELRKQVQALNGDYHTKALALLDSAQKEKLEALQQAAQRAARSRQVVSGATALNLLLPPVREQGTRAPRP